MIYCLSKAHELGLITCTDTQSHNWVKSEDTQWNLNNFLEHPGAKKLGLNFQVSNITLFHLGRELWGVLRNRQWPKPELYSALNNKGGRGQRYPEEIGAGATWKMSIKINTSIKNGKFLNWNVSVILLARLGQPFFSLLSSSFFNMFTCIFRRRNCLGKFKCFSLQSPQRSSWVTREEKGTQDP